MHPKTESHTPPACSAAVFHGPFLSCIFTLISHPPTQQTISSAPASKAMLPQPKPGTQGPPNANFPALSALPPLEGVCQRVRVRVRVYVVCACMSVCAPSKYVNPSPASGAARRSFMPCWNKPRFAFMAACAHSCSFVDGHVCFSLYIH
jgi:hypothetical protein